MFMLNFIAFLPVANKSNSNILEKPYSDECIFGISLFVKCVDNLKTIFNWYS